MTEKNTKKLLMLLQGMFPSFVVSRSTILGWNFALANKSARAVEQATRFLVDNVDNGAKYVPNASEFCALVERFENPTQREAVEIFFDGPSKAQSEDERAAWKRWGGSERWGCLPSRDPKYCQDLKSADFSWKQAENNFREIISAMRTKRRVSKCIETTSREASAFLETLGESARQLGTSSAQRLK